MKEKKLENIKLQIIFIGPALIFFTVIVVVPFLMGMGYSMTKWNGVSSNVTFVGFKNFSSLLSDEYFMKSLFFTVRFSVAAVILGNLCAFFLALLLTSAIRLKKVYRAAFFIPNMVSGFILGFIWQFIFVKIFAKIGELTSIGFFELPWLGTANTGFWALVIVQLWQMSGYLMVIYIAGLSNVPVELTESLKIDGAGRIQELRYLTIPMIMPSITVSLFMSINTTFKMFDLNYTLTHGNFDTRSLAMDIYAEAFTNSNYGLGTAKALIFCLLVGAITVAQTMYTKRKEIEA
ncbi:MAG: sugar ABC transporter permease [Clostridia bacterium]|nr:sugar ABC transporter permease [Clostridia bacterium]